MDPAGNVTRARGGDNTAGIPNHPSGRGLAGALRLWVAMATLFLVACRLQAAAPGERLARLAGMPSQAALPTDRPLEVLVWNIEKARNGELPQWFDSLQFDIALIQEAYDIERMQNALAARPDMHWQMGISFFYHRSIRTATGVLNGAIAAPTRSVVMHAPTLEPVTDTPKATLISYYPLQGRPERLLVVNIHAINFRVARHLDRQLRQLSSLIERHRGPVLLGGDLNTHHRPRMRVLEAFARDHGLAPVFSNWAGDSARTGKEALGANNRRRPANDKRRSFLGWPLDHLYVRGLAVEKAAILTTVEVSDHPPLWARVRVVD